MTSEQLTAILLAAIAAPGFWEVLKNIIDKVTNRRRVTNEELADSLKEIRKGHDAQQKDIDGLKVSIQQMQESESVKDAQAARRRILRFNDELLRSIDHSKEYFDDILEDIKIYNRYCDEHKDFANGKTVMAKKNIEHCYEQCMEKHSFLN